MAEELILTDPIIPPAPPATTTYRVSSFTMDLDTKIAPPPPASPTTAPPGLVQIKLRDNNGKYSDYQYIGDAATAMIKQLNTANLTNKSMHKRILERLSADGLIPGTVVGAPD